MLKVFYKKVVTMKKMVLCFVVFFLFCVVFIEPVYAISEDTVLPENYTFDGILNIYGTPSDLTRVQIQSADISFIIAYDAEVINYDGDVEMWYAYRNSLIKLYGGKIGWLKSMDSSYVTIDGGSVREGIISEDNSEISIIDGDSYWLRSWDDSIINLRGASLGFMGAHDESTINVYGYDLIKTSYGGRGYGYVRGKWEEGGYFNIPFFDSDTHTHVVLHESLNQLLYLY